ncbi:MAG TPA: class I SAM-dependent methyltransferase [Tepidisphaeraceae bacterium]|nr:class I SAM-dependent methyltransferase [Tepidisphaeraceae bacterium]
MKRKRLIAPPPKTKTTDWTPVASWYDQLVGESGSEYHREVVLPGVMRLLGAEKGQRVLDVACGQGVLARLLAAKGVNVVGVESARPLIEAAQKYDTALPPDAPPPTFIVGDVRELDRLPVGRCDAAACILAIQNIHPIAPVLQGVASALKDHGRFVIVMMHPCFRGSKETSWGWDGTAVQYRRVDRYLLPRKSPIVAHPGSDPHTYTWTFHKPIEAYVKSLRQAGLLIDAIEEWPSHKTSQPGPRAAAENTARKEIPMFMAIRAVKPLMNTDTHR